MKRRLEQLKDREYDILIIGGGILGLFIAWDAALRGLSVALIDKGDFGGATSSNSLRIIHGGFRHIQYLDFSSTRRFMKEQRILMKLAPHLVRPMPVIIPLYNSNFFTKKSFDAALKVYDLLAIGLGASKHSGLEKFNNRVITREECIDMIPDIEKNNLSGGIIFTDCQLSNSEHFSLTIAASAFEEGANLANYVQALGLNIKNNRVKGAFVRDIITRDEFEIRAKFTVNSSGPWLNYIPSRTGINSSLASSGNLKAFNLAIRRDLTKGYALGLNTKIKNPTIQSIFSKKSRYLFITPWKGKSLIGTEYLPSNDDPDNFKETLEEIGSFLDDINTCYPAASLKTDDVEFVYGGYVPTYSVNDGKPKIGVRTHLLDHEKENGPGGLFSARGSKYTEARIVAEECVDLIMTKMGKTFRSSLTGLATPYSGNISNLQDNSNMENKKNSIVSSQIVFAIREEMARKLSDIVFRRLDLDFEEIRTNLKQYSEVMAKELNWDNSTRNKEEAEVISRLPIFH